MMERRRERKRDKTMGGWSLERRHTRRRVKERVVLPFTEEERERKRIRDAGEVDGGEWRTCGDWGWRDSAEAEERR